VSRASAASAAQGGAAPLERSLDLLIERLTIARQTPRVRALRIEALRLRSIMANWRSIPPLPEVREAMLARVLHVVSAAGDLPLDHAPPRPPPIEVYDQGPISEVGDDVVESDEEPGVLEATEDGVHVLPSDEPPTLDPPRVVALTAPGHFRHRPAYDGFPVDAFDEPPWARRGQNGHGGGMPPTAWRGVPFGSSGVPELPAPPATTVEVHIERLPEEIDPRLVMLREPTSVQSDSFRALRQRLATTGDPKVIAVSSATDGDGKSTAAANLALAYREVVRGGRVLLLEANVRRPAMAAMFGFDPPECFIEQLARHRDDAHESWIAVEQVAPLHVMAVDARIERTPLLDPVAFSVAMKQLALAGYDYVVIDTPSILDGADVNLILESVEGLLIAARAGKTRQASLTDAIERLGPATVFGAVLLDAQPS
jgi:Mrp family chromosome partitioning ATPase